MLQQQNQKTNSNLEQQLVDDMARFSKDPLGWVMYSFDWGNGELSDYDGPEEWQRTLLNHVGQGLLTIDEAIQTAVSSGHGIGKSAMVSWLILWGLSTFEDTKIVVTANTEAQLRTKTMPEVQKWFRLFIANHWFVITATAIYSADKAHEKTWRMDMIPWSDTNTESFAGLHNKGKRIMLIFDEGSAISDAIWEVSEGALTDKNTEIIWCVFGNPTRNTGRFFDCFHKNKHRWFTLQVDSRTVRGTNKKQIQNWIEDHGENSDFVKVRVRGIFPSASDRQFIGTAMIDEAKGRKLNQAQYAYAPTVIGVDPAYTGGDETVIVLRQGLICKVLARYQKNDDDFTMAGYVAQFETQYNADAVFIDQGYGTGIVSGGRQLGRNWMLIAFGGGSTKSGFLNKRAEMWGDMKKWIQEGAGLPDDNTLAAELGTPEYTVNLKGQIVIESKDSIKKRGLSSPNIADALCLTFAFPVEKKNPFGSSTQQFVKKEYDPLG